MVVCTTILVSIMNKQFRCSMIIKYISVYPGCNAEKAFKGVEDWMARGTFFNLLKELKEEGVIYEGQKDKPKSRNTKLFVNGQNLLVTVPKDLEHFENTFFVLLKKALDSLETHSSSPVSYDLISKPLFLFYEMVNVYHLLALISWPMAVLEKDTLQKLYIAVFTKLGEMQIRIYDMLRASRFVNANLALQSSILRRYLYSTDKWSQCYDVFSKLGMQKEIESTLDSLWDIKKIYRQYAHPEPGIFGWAYDYDEDGWRKLLELQRQHPEQTYEVHLDRSSDTSFSNTG
jgi:hypothetical protein